MKTTRRQNLLAAALVGVLAFIATVAHAADPLPSWNDGKAKQSIMAFVEKVTQPGSPNFVPVPERIATFDNDGCLWAEQPMYFQALFVVASVAVMKLTHPIGNTRRVIQLQQKDYQHGR